MSTFFGKVEQELAEKLAEGQKEEYSSMNRKPPTIDNVSGDNHQHLSKQLAKIKPKKLQGQTPAEEETSA